MNLFANDNLPPSSNQPVLNIPPITKILLGLMIIGFLGVHYLPMDDYMWVVNHFGFSPAPWSGKAPFSVFDAVSLISHIFLHGGWTHFLMNGFMLLAFGSAVEKMTNRKSYLIFIVASALGGCIGQFLLNPETLVPMIGISAVLNGLFGVILIFMNKSGQKQGLMPFILLWVAMTIGFGVYGTPGLEMGAVAWGAHLGGFATGLIVGFQMSRQKN